MQVLAIGFAAPRSPRASASPIPQAIQAGTAFFLGMLLGAWGFGRLADRIGRRRVLIVTVLIDAVFGLASVFAHDFTLLLALRLLTGIGVGGTLPVDYAMMAEFLPPRRRGRWLVALEGFWAVGTIAVALAAWAANHLGRRPGLALAVRRHRAARPHRLLAPPLAAGIAALPPASRRGAAGARGPRPHRRAPTGRRRPPRRSSPPPRQRARLRDLLGPGLRQRTLLILAAWLLVSTAYYGVFIWLPGRLVTEGYGFVRGYGFLVLLALAQLPGYALAALGIETIGRRPHAGGLPLRQRRRLPAVRRRRAAGLDRHRPARHELRAARHLGRPLRLHARALPHRPARHRHGHRPAPWPASAASSRPRPSR